MTGLLILGAFAVLLVVVDQICRRMNARMKPVSRRCAFCFKWRQGQDDCVYCGTPPPPESNTMHPRIAEEIRDSLKKANVLAERQAQALETIATRLKGLVPADPTPATDTGLYPPEVERRLAPGWSLQIEDLGGGKTGPMDFLHRDGTRIQTHDVGLAEKAGCIFRACDL